MPERGALANLETIAAASPKFTAPLLLVHGLWCGAAVWRKFMGHCAHRGWVCHALTQSRQAHLPRPDTVGSGSRPSAGLAARETELREAISKFESPPIVIGHDLGGWLAVRVAAVTRAAVALAPVVPGRSSVPAPRGPGQWLKRLSLGGGDDWVPPRGRLHGDCFGAGIPGETFPEPRRLLRELADDAAFPTSTNGVPTLVVAGALDAVTPAGVTRQLAERCAADFVSLSGATHALPWTDGWERAVAEVHRWLVRSLGEALFVPRDEEDES